MDSATCCLVSALIVFLGILCLIECKTEIRTESICYNTSPCTDKYHTLMCESKKRIAVHHAVYGFKSSDQCPTVTDCNNSTDTSCCDTDEAGDCQMAFHQEGIDQIVEDCYGQSRCSFPSPKTSGSCSDSTVKVSSYSKLYYRCIAESTIADFCSVETVRGESTFSVYDPRGSNFKSGTCSCTVDSANPSVKANIQVYGVYMRLNGTAKANQCSKLTIYDRDTAYVFGCDNDKKVEQEEEQQEQSLLNTTTPVTVRLALSPTSPPRYVWIGFEANDAANLVLRCHADEGNIAGVFNKLVGDADGIDPDFVAAILFGVLIMVVVLSVTLAGFPWYMRKLAAEMDSQKQNGVIANGESAPKTRRSSRDPKIYVEMEEAMNGAPVGNSIPMETRTPYYSDAYESKQKEKRKKSEPKVVPAPQVPKPFELQEVSEENTCYLGMDSPTGRQSYLGSETQESTGSDGVSMIYSEPYAMMSSCSSFKEDNYTCPSLTSTLTLRSNKVDQTENNYEAAFGDEDKDNLKRPEDRVVDGSSVVENEDEYLLPVTPDIGKDRRASVQSLEYACIPTKDNSPGKDGGRRRSLSYFVNQAFDVTDRPPLPPPMIGREPLADRKPLVEVDEGPLAPAESEFANSEYFMDQ
ncbi:uncharacterized protein LOC124139967 [Haliotis rufescens]|uniref:uncharacterized protein LOC124139967 n=1 Tax=Haliotis rufescens TaxID=6454 RepID=UPI00201FA26C|nr:uncharacterized protein LOC124139967 [Haliotis rufescens]